MDEFVVITGLSGAGRSEAAGDLEDLGWFVIDNLPAELIPKVAELAAGPGTRPTRVALVLRAGAELDQIPPALDALRHSGATVRVLFLDASTDTLVRRYEHTRRRHPLVRPGGSLTEAIERERLLFEPVRADADVVVDTSTLNVHELRRRVGELFATDGTGSELHVTVSSFGYKHGLPVDVDMVLDCRFLPNPHWVEELRPLTGLDAEVARYVVSRPEATAFVEIVDELLAVVVPALRDEGRAYLTVAFGCTGGRHRSVAIAESVAERLRARAVQVAVTHRDLQR